MTNEGELRACVAFSAARCWSGWCDISPTKPVPLAGYAGKERLCEADARGLEANWTVFPCTDETIILVLAVDALFSSDFFEAAVASALRSRGWTVSALWVVASHSHFAPQLDPAKPKLGRLVVKHLRYVAEKIACSVSQSLLNESTGVAEIRHGTALASGAVHRRRPGWKLRGRVPFLQRMAIPAPNDKVQIDKNLRLWLLTNADGRPITVFAHWSCHTVSSLPRNRASAAHVGAIRQAVRQALSPKLPVLFMSGCSGDIRPDFPARLLSRRCLAPYPFQPGFAPPSTAQVTAFEAGLAKAAQQAATNLTSLGGGENGKYLASTSELLANVPLVIRRLNIGPISFLGFNCEPSHDWVPLLGFDHGDNKVALTGYVGEVFGYLPTPQQVRKGGYEVDGFRGAFEFVGNWRDAQGLTEKVRALVNKDCAL